jgi:hypothetical protein
MPRGEEAGRRPGRYLPPLSMSIPMLIFGGASLALPLATARALQLTEAQVGAWILALYGRLRQE